MSKKRRAKELDRKQKRQRTWPEYGKQVAAGAAAAPLGFIAGNTAGAYTAAELAYNFTAPNLDIVFPKKSNSNMSYKGGFRPYKVSSSYDKLKTKTQSYGVVVNRETYGKVNDPNAVYITHSTFSLPDFSMAIACAVIRKLLAKAGYCVTNVDEVIPLRAYNDSGASWKFEWAVENSDGTRSDFVYAIP